MAEFNLKDIPSQKGRIAIVTGANIGLGYETALGFIQKDIKVIMACRNLQKAEEAKENLQAQVPNGELEIMQIDLGNMESIRSFAKTFLKKYDKLDLLVNNAGLMIPPYSQTDDGFELQFGVNHLGHFSYELDRRLKAVGASTLSVAAHPGASDTNLGQYISEFMVKILKPLLTLSIVQSAKAGAEPTLYAALGENVKGGDYFGPSGFAELKGRAKKVTSTKRSHNKADAKRLWEMSEALTKHVLSV